MKEAKTVLIGLIQNESELVRIESLFSKLKKSTNAFHHQSLFFNLNKIVSNCIVDNISLSWRSHLVEL